MNRFTACLSLSCLTAFMPTLVLSQTVHEPLPTSATLTFDSVYRSALALAPEAPAANARDQQAESVSALGRRWINNRPRLQTSYIDDGLLDDVGLKEIEAGIAVNLWRPGERSQVQALGSSYETSAKTWRSYFALLVAGRVRDNLADIDRAAALLELESQATDESERLLETTTALFEAGTVAELDVLQARGLLLEQRRVELEAEAGLVDAELAYRVLTGLEIRPVQEYSELQSDQTEIDSGHPYLQHLRSEVEIAAANIDKARRDAKGSPSMTLGVRRERGQRLLPYTDSFGVSFSVPFGGNSVVSASVSSARSDKVDADIEFTRAYQSLEALLHEIEHELYLVAESLTLSREQADINQRHWQMSQTAFEVGENTLAQVIIALQTAQASEKNHRLLLLQQQRLITEYNQAVGELP